MHLFCAKYISILYHVSIYKMDKQVLININLSADHRRTTLVLTIFLLLEKIIKCIPPASFCFTMLPNPHSSDFNTQSLLRTSYKMVARMKLKGPPWSKRQLPEECTTPTWLNYLYNYKARLCTFHPQCVLHVVGVPPLSPEKSIVTFVSFHSCQLFGISYRFCLSTFNIKSGFSINFVIESDSIVPTAIHTNFLPLPGLRVHEVATIIEGRWLALKRRSGLVCLAIQARDPMAERSCIISSLTSLAYCQFSDHLQSGPSEFVA